MNGIAPKYWSVVGADAVDIAAGNRSLEVQADEIQRGSTTGVADASEYVEYMKVSWEARMALLWMEVFVAQALKRKNYEKGLRVAESTIRATKRVMIVEQRVGR